MSIGHLSAEDQLDDASENHPVLRKVLRFTIGTVVAGAFLCAGVAAAFLLHARAEAEAPPQLAPPVSVATITARILPGYDVESSYVGRLEPGRQTDVAFERAGLVTQVRFDEGDEVQAGEIVAELDTSQLAARRDQLLAQRRALEAQGDLANVTLGRQSRLKTKGWSADQRYDEARSNFARLAAEIEQITARIGELDIDIAKSSLKAPYSGTIAARSIDEGAVVTAGAPVVRLLETGHRQARIGLPPAIAAKLQLHETHSVRINGRSYPTRLTAKRADLQSGTRTVTALFDLSGDEMDVSFGELVTIDLQTTVSEPGAWLPLTALQEGRRGMWTVLVVGHVDGSSVVHPEAVEVLHTKNNRAFVRGTFADGARIISNGTSRVVAGQRVAMVKE